MKKVLLIVNPVAGKMKAKTTLLRVVSELQSGGFLVNLRLTDKKGRAREITAEACNGYDMVVCFGGDGTLNETVSGMIDNGIDLPLGYIPAGSTNDFASGMKLSFTPSKAADNIIKGEPVMIDIGKFNNDRYFTYVAAFGVFTAASYNVPQDVKNIWGHLAYVAEGVKEITNIRSYKVKIQIDDKVIEDEFMFGAVANSTSVAGIVKLNESLVDISDGMFEVGLIRKPKTLDELNRIVTAIATSNFDVGGVEFYKASKVVVESLDSPDWTLDGEFAKGETKVVIENLNRAIKFIK